jgi:multiple sugar transport system permease protein
MLDGDFGVLNYALRELSLIDRPTYWLIDPDTALAGTILANIWVGIPFNMMLLWPACRAFPPRSTRRPASTAPPPGSGSGR